MATAGDIITAAFIKVGVEVPTTAQTASALISLNDMVSSWGAEGLMYSVVSESFSIVALDSEYTIGSGGQWDTVRPIRVISCFLRDSDNTDYPISILSSRSYNQMPDKHYDGQPTGLYFLPEYPLAKIIFNARPDVSIDAYFEFLKNFTEFATTATSVTLPPEYKEALVYNLAISLGEDWDRTIGQTVIMNAVRTKGILDHVLATQRVVPVTRFADIGVRPYSGGNDDLIDGGAF
jgi:hypothetical protein